MGPDDIYPVRMSEVGRHWQLIIIIINRRYCFNEVFNFNQSYCKNIKSNILKGFFLKLLIRNVLTKLRYDKAVQF